MNGNLANPEGIVRYTTGTLLRIVVGAAPNACVVVRRVQLAGREKLHITVVETIEGQIDGPGAIDGGQSVTDFVGLTNDCMAVGESARGTSDVGVRLKVGILAADDRRGGELKERED